jgi:hypothetical protein
MILSMNNLNCGGGKSSNAAQTNNQHLDNNIAEEM